MTSDQDTGLGYRARSCRPKLLCRGVYDVRGGTATRATQRGARSRHTTATTGITYIPRERCHRDEVSEGSAVRTSGRRMCAWNTKRAAAAPATLLERLNVRTDWGGRPHHPAQPGLGLLEVVMHEEEIFFAGVRAQDSAGRKEPIAVSTYFRRGGIPTTMR